MNHQNFARRSGFTLIELTVVLAIAAIVTAITVGGITELKAGNKKLSCQANLAQIYLGVRQYVADNGTVPPYSLDNDYGLERPAGQHGIGLWALYGFPDSANYDAVAPSPDTVPPSSNSRPNAIYIRASRVLHCPSDWTHDFLFNSGGTVYNLNYLSYQVPDSISASNTYIPVRTTNTITADWTRQLIHYSGTTLIARPPDDDTIITWCQWHRTGMGGRSYDNVLFYDGTVQYLPQTQPDPSGGAIPLLDWHRKPRPSS